MFITGQKVVCIDDKFDPNIVVYYTALPKENTVYVVRGVTCGIAPDNKTDEICVYLIGLVNPKSNVAPYRERGFRAERFRPLEELTEDEIMQLVKTDEAEESLPFGPIMHL